MDMYTTTKKNQMYVSDDYIIDLSEVLCIVATSVTPTIIFKNKTEVVIDERTYNAIKASYLLTDRINISNNMKYGYVRHDEEKSNVC